MKKILFGLFTVVFLVGCQSDDEEIPTEDDFKNTTYKVTFTLNWSATNFPQNYPSNAHFSPLIGWSHNTNTTLFDEGTTATDGIKSMAETGATTTLKSELEAKITNKEGLDIVVGSGLSSGTGSIEVAIKVNKNNPMVTLSTMIAPSPDWYAAIVDANLLENGSFVTQKTVEITAYDAGTDSGSTYTAANKTTNPVGKISKITTAPLKSSVAIGSVTFKKM